MIEFILYDGSQLDTKIMLMWEEEDMWCRLNYEDFVRSLDPKIVNATVNGDYESITITFESEEYKTWFIMRWS